MELEEAAKLFEAWAWQEGMLAAEHPSIGLPPSQPNLINARSTPGIEFLRSKQIQMVGFNKNLNQVVVFLKRAAPRSKKALAALPSTVDGYAISYEQGTIDTVGSLAHSPYGAPYAVLALPHGKFYTCGSSISVGNTREAGTFSCLLRDINGKLYGLSNNHVSGSCSQAPIGMPIIAPGVLDVTAGAHPPFTLGFHSNALQMVPGAPDVVAYKDNFDASIFEIADPTLVSSKQQTFYDTPATTMPLASGMIVEKVGRTTGRKTGQVIAEVTGPIPVNYSASSYGFAGQVYFDNVFVTHGTKADGRFSLGGDSGSLVVHTDGTGTRHAVGLVFAGGDNNLAPGGGHTLVLPIEPLLARLKMTLVSGHNV